MKVVYYVYGERGFWGRTGQWTSQLSEAATFSRESAISFCARHYNRHENVFGCVPVAEDDLDSLVTQP